MCCYMYVNGESMHHALYTHEHIFASMRTLRHVLVHNDQRITHYWHVGPIYYFRKILSAHFYVDLCRVSQCEYTFDYL